MLRKRLMAVVLSAVMTAAIFTGCASKDDSSKSDNKSAKTEQQKSDAKEEKSKDSKSEAAKAPIEDGTYTAEFKTDSTIFHVNEANEGKGMKVKKWMRPVFQYLLPLVILFIYIYGMITFQWK